MLGFNFHQLKATFSGLAESSLLNSPTSPGLPLSALHTGFARYERLKAHDALAESGLVKVESIRPPQVEAASYTREETKSKTTDSGRRI